MRFFNHPRWIRYATLAGGILLVGCASLTPEQCRYGDWYAIGEQDGMAGRSAMRLADHREACAKVGVVPDQFAWAQGRQAGLARYCTTNRAYQLGRQGNEFNFTVCPDDSALQQAYARGTTEYQKAEKLRKLHEKMQELKASGRREIEENHFATQRELILYQENLILKIQALQHKIDLLEQQPKPSY